LGGFQRLLKMSEMLKFAKRPISPQWSISANIELSLKTVRHSA
jgi:hypothetical protein